MSRVALKHGGISKRANYSSKSWSQDVSASGEPSVWPVPSERLVFSRALTEACGGRHGFQLAASRVAGPRRPEPPTPP
ncbi:hypothetical protein EYF80_036212 [Liparis tanakae]|uniref:Uncharacterized protein n=1 Tax=Liparis tanakae TaxID=230148 RepID=A0A4Z2GJV5_9TELE|nr:hypothetical protein EYF80_036212 [Liparis tanakae]